MKFKARSLIHSLSRINLVMICALFSSSLLAHQNGETSDAPALTDIATAYQTIVTTTDKSAPLFSDHWNLWRYGNSIEVLKSNKQIGERWELLRNDQMTYTWSSHPDEFSVLHANTSLAFVGENTPWENKATVIDRALLKQLEKAGSEIYLDLPAQRYQGVINDVEIELLWIESLQIPARVVQKYQDQTTLLALKEVYSFPEAPWQPVDTNVYFEVDYTDIGDHEAEPLIQKYVQMISRQDPSSPVRHQH